MVVYVVLLSYSSKTLPIFDWIPPSIRSGAAIVITLVVALTLARMVALSFQTARVSDSWWCWTITVALSILLFFLSALAILTVFVESSEGQAVHVEAIAKVKKSIIKMRVLAESAQPPAPEYDRRLALLNHRWEQVKGESMNLRPPLCGIGSDTLRAMAEIERSVLDNAKILLPNERRTQANDILPCANAMKNAEFQKRIDATFRKWRTIADEALLNLPDTRSENARQIVDLRKDVIRFGGETTIAELEKLSADLKKGEWGAQEKALKYAAGLGEAYNTLFQRMKNSNAQGLESLPDALDESLKQAFGLGKSLRTLPILVQRAEGMSGLRLFAALIALLVVDVAFVALTHMMCSQRLVRERDQERHRKLNETLDDEGYRVIRNVRYLWVTPLAQASKE